VPDAAHHPGYFGIPEEGLNRAVDREGSGIVTAARGRERSGSGLAISRIMAVGTVENRE
jgi:hypothetical protein